MYASRPTCHSTSVWLNRHYMHLTLHISAAQTLHCRVPCSHAQRRTESGTDVSLLTQPCHSCSTFAIGAGTLLAVLPACHRRSIAKSVLLMLLACHAEWNFAMRIATMTSPLLRHTCCRFGIVRRVVARTGTICSFECRVHVGCHIQFRDPLNSFSFHGPIDSKHRILATFMAPLTQNIEFSQLSWPR